MASAGRILIMPKGAYDASATYEMLDMVSHNGTTWLAKKTVSGVAPSNESSEFWHDMVEIDTVVANKIAELSGSWTLPALNDGFEVYSEGTSEVRYRKIGDVVYIRGAVKPSVDIESDKVTTIFNLPSGYRPSKLNVNGIMQGTGMNKWCLSITTGGAVNVQRYGTTTNDTIPAGSWLNLDISYPLG